jgi:hypothetical protein
MDATPEAFAYRCLPLNIANAHGWEVLSPCGFSATWDGRAAVDGVGVVLDPGQEGRMAPVALFGQGVLTFHVEAIMRTPPGWNLWIGGSPNRQKDGIAPLTGIVETDWSPFTFTMNWRFTRPNCPIRFEAGEPMAFVFPVRRGALDAFDPTFAMLGDDAETERRHLAWSQARDAFQAKVAAAPPAAGTDRWQKHYYRGVDVAGQALVDDHQAKLRLKAFDRAATPQVPAAPRDDAALPAPGAPPPNPSDEIAALRRALAKRDWLLDTLERHRHLTPTASGIERRGDLGADEFLERYYAMGRPVILTGELSTWPALSRWSPEYLKRRIGPAVVEYQAGRAANTRFEIDKAAHRTQGPFDGFIDAITSSAGNDAYLTAYNASGNAAALAPLAEDMGPLEKFLTPGEGGMFWVGPAGTLTALHHDLTNNLIAQIVGRKHLRILPPSEVAKLDNDEHVFSRIADLDDPAVTLEAFPRLEGARVYDVVLAPGEIIFMPIAWWHQVRALDFSVTATFTNFRWPNDAHATYPAG